jgi:uncharacterized protein (UPF0276 family)
LNVFGENDWERLAGVARSIRTLNPRFVVEHYTAFKPMGLTKTGVHFPESRPGDRHEHTAIENVARWRDLLGVGVSLENVPVISSAKDYLRSLQRVCERTKVPITWDLAHLFLSLHSLGSERLSNARDLLHELQPFHFHVSGLRNHQGMIWDTHDRCMPWLLEWGIQLLGSPKLVTLEQSRSLSVPDAKHLISQFTGRDSRIPRLDGLMKLASPSERMMNQGLIQEKLEWLFPSLSVGDLENDLNGSVELTPCCELLSEFDDSFTFLRPWSTFDLASKCLTPHEAVRCATTLIDLTLAHRTWVAGQDKAFASLIYIDRDATCRLEKRFSSRGPLPGLVPTYLDSSFESNKEWLLTDKSRLMLRFEGLHLT